MGKFVFGLIVGLIVIPLGVYLYFSTGTAPVATSAPPMPFEKTLAQMALHARQEKEMPKTVPIAADETAYAAGAQVYKEHCAVCHGLPGVPQTAIAKGMFPKPPKLMEGTGVTDDPPARDVLESCRGNSDDGNAGFRQRSLDDPDLAGQFVAGECG